MARGLNGAKHDEWRRRLARFDASGLTIVNFCRREQVSQASFYYWSKRIQEGDHSTTSGLPRFDACTGAAERGRKRLRGSRRRRFDSRPDAYGRPGCGGCVRPSVTERAGGRSVGHHESLPTNRVDLMMPGGLTTFSARVSTCIVRRSTCAQLRWSDGDRASGAPSRCARRRVVCVYQSPCGSLEGTVVG